MYPDLLGPFSEYPVPLVLAAAAGCALTVWQARRDPIRLGGLVTLLAVTAFSSIIGAKLYAVAGRGGGFHGIAWEMGNGFRYAGGAMAAFAVMPLAARWLTPQLQLARLGDMSAISTSFALALMRVGCFVQGCCHGIPTTLPWAIRFPPDSSPWKAHLGAGLIDAESPWSVPVHPLQAYFGLSSLALALFLLRFRSQQRYAGQTFLMFLLLDGLAKSLLESLRFGHAPNLQWVALAQALLGGTVLSAKALWDRRAVERLA